MPSSCSPTSHPLRSPSPPAAASAAAAPVPTSSFSPTRPSSATAGPPRAPRRSSRRCSAGRTGASTPGGASRLWPSGSRGRRSSWRSVTSPRQRPSSLRRLLSIRLEDFMCFTRAGFYRIASSLERKERELLSAARLALGNHSAALEDAKESSRIAPTYPQAYICQGDAFIAMEEYDAAKQAYSTALELDPSIGRSKSFKARLLKLKEKLASANT